MNGCKNPQSIDCIVVDKVYDSCFQVEDIVRTTEISLADEFTNTFNMGELIPCAQAGAITCKEVGEREPIADGFFRLNVMISIPIMLTNPKNKTEYVVRVFSFIKQLVLCSPVGVELECTDSTVSLCTCIVTEIFSGYEPTISVACNLQLCIVIKAVAKVQLLIPSFGPCMVFPCEAQPALCPVLPPQQC